MTRAEIQALIKAGSDDYDEWVQAIDHYRALYDQGRALLELTHARIDSTKYQELAELADEIDAFLLKTVDEQD